MCDKGPSTSRDRTHCFRKTVSRDTLGQLINEPDSSSSSEDEFSDYDVVLTEPLRVPTPTSSESSVHSEPSNEWVNDPSSMETFQYEGVNGLKVDTENLVKPMDYFSLLANNAFFQLLARETNVQAEYILLRGSRHPRFIRSKWYDVTCEEMKIFLGLLLHMSVIQCSRTRDYWKTHRLFNIPCFSQYMACDRFRLIMKCFHFSPNPREGEPIPNDRIYKLRPLLNHFVCVMEKIYEPGSILCIDESMVLRCGRLTFRRCIKNKNHKYGLKLYALTEPNGLTLKFAVYTGRLDDTEESGHSENVVLHLLKTRLGIGHSVYMVNCYSSFSLSKKLLTRKTYSTGILRIARKDTPKVVIEQPLLAGEVVCQYSEGVAIGKWRDRRDTLFISTKHKLDMQELRTQRGETKMKPTAIIECNRLVKGVYRKDQMISYYPASRKTARWYKKLGIHIIETMLFNSFVLYNKFSGNRISLYDFRLAVIEELLPHNYVHSKNLQLPSPSSKKVQRQFQQPDELHIPTKCKKSENRRTLRKRCKVCYTEGRRKDSMFFCPKCPDKPGLCLEECFEKFHKKAKSEYKQ